MIASGIVKTDVHFIRAIRSEFRRLKLPSVMVGTIFVLINPGFYKVSYSLTSGPSQPEFQSFKPTTSTNLVDPFTGDFSYSIPLLNVGEYPITLNYQSGVSMNQEASWVGLGWNLNPGVISRNVRGIPDDFSNDEVTREFNMKDNETGGGSFGVGLEIFGDSSISTEIGLGLSVGAKHNTYKGASVEFGLSPGISSGESSKTSLTANLGVSADNGVTFSPSVSYTSLVGLNTSWIEKGTVGIGGGAGITLNSRHGLEQISFNSIGTVSSAAVSPHHSSVKNYSYGFLDRGYTPSIEMPIQNLSHSYGARVGLEVIGLTGNVNAVLNYSLQEVESNSYSLPAYGYIYAHKAEQNERILQDTDRSDSGEIIPSQPLLPMGYLTHDIFNVTAHGLSGSFRAKRNDIGLLHEPSTSLGGISGANAVLEIAGGNAIKVGADVVVNHVSSTVGPWKDDNALAETLSFTGLDPSNLAYAPVFFKALGELTVNPNSEMFDSLGGYEPVHVKLGNLFDSPPFSIHSAQRCLVRGAENRACIDSVEGFPAKNKSVNRTPQNLHFSYLTAKEASIVGLDRQIRYYSDDMRYYSANADELERNLRLSLPVDRVSGYRKPHHMSEITITRDDGTRYIYGLPVYNTAKEEVSFSVDSQDDCDSNDPSLTGYSDNDASTSNNAGRSGYFSKTITPPYAYAFPVTAMISPDYNDKTGDGPTADDNGTYVKFNYKLAHSRYRWRTPYSKQTCALYQNSLTADPRDDMASYVYGEKEIVYAHSIETRNYVAEFYTEDRQDSLGTESRKGKVGDQKLQALKMIKLFNKAERIRVKDQAVPIKTVYLDYDYSLAPNTKNASTGKLTLKSVRFSYRKSDKAMLSPYRFEYDSNTDYNNTAVDRWGNYKPISREITNTRFPYVNQTDREAANENAAMFLLTKINLPSGGYLEVDYEAKDYAYVQDKRAQYMAMVAGTGKDPSNPCGEESPTSAYLQQDNEVYSYLCFDLLEPINSLDKLKEYVVGIENLYVNAAIYVSNTDDRSAAEPTEIIRDFVPILQTDTNRVEVGFDEGSFSLSSENYSRAWIKVPPIVTPLPPPAPPRTRHPLTQTSLDFIKRYLSYLINEHSSPYGTDFGEALVNTIFTFQELWRDVDSRLLGEGNGETLNHKKSFIRLNHPSKNKLGGGARVKAITLNDQWGEMTQRTGALKDQLDFDYRKEFEYTTTEIINGISQEISSGVAQYEPNVGGDENPLVQPLFYEFSGTKLHQLTPIGESFYPSPIIGYSKTKMSNVRPELSSRPATTEQHDLTGYELYEFYTAKDFPIISAMTIKDKNNPSNISFGLLPFEVDYLTASQGYVIELNNMHGKPKANWVFSAGQNNVPIRGTSYQYKTDDASHTLSDTAPVLIKNNMGKLAVSEGQLGIDFDVYFDAREHMHSVHAPGGQLNVDGFFASIIPIFIPSGYPAYSYAETRFRSIITTKVISRTAILESVTTHENGSQLSSENLVWDGETGQVVLTRTDTEHEQSIYTLTIPAHAEYQGMAGAWKNHGVYIDEIIVNVGGIAIVEGASDLFYRGDEVILTPKERSGTSEEQPPFKAWVYDVKGDELVLIDTNGYHLGSVEFGGSYKDIKVIRSGHRNQQSQSVGQITSISNPVNTDGEITPVDVVNSHATEFSDLWHTRDIYQVGSEERALGNYKVEVPIFECNIAYGKAYNPYWLGILGNWRPKKTWSYLTNRESNPLSYQSGAYTAYAPYWNSIEGANQEDWHWKAQSVVIDPKGRSVASVDALNRYSAALHGHELSKVTASANNSRHEQILFEGFEDYLYFNRPKYIDSGECNSKPHWSFYNPTHNTFSESLAEYSEFISKLDYLNSHSGSVSIRLTNEIMQSERKIEEWCDAERSFPENDERIYLLRKCDVIGGFNPFSESPVKKYLLSAWIATSKELERNPDPLLVTGPVIEVEIEGGETYRSQPVGKPVDGWQRIESEFMVPQDATKISISLSSGPVKAWFDDIRVHPFNANMNTYVYDPFDLRYRASLDENNFARFYEYDEEGSLARVKRETERGVLTINESFSAFPKRSP